MKTKIFRGCKVVLALFAVPLLAGSIVAPQAEKEIEEVATNGVAAVSVTNSVVETDDLVEEDSEPLESNGTNAVLAELELPKPAAADVKLSPGAAEIVKMAESGVEEQVMISFATNYPSKFNLDSEQIIYLNDLGISGDVVRTMIQRDAALTEMAVAQAATNNLPQVATNYVAGINGTNLYYPPTNYDGQVMDLGYNPNYTSSDPGADADYDYFGSSLSPYGSWIYISGYGRCWRPTVAVVNTGWQPYCDRGRWVYTDCGWYWQSDYSWGWAPFHYGRWFCDTRHGWVWRPGRVWGPAWVSWRRSNDYCGWAPLPPEAHWVPGHGFSYWNRSVGVSFDFGLRWNHYTFVPVDRFCDYAPYRYRVSPTQITKVYNNTVVINNITVKDHKVINHGIDPKRVEQASRTEIRKAVIKDGAPGKDKTIKPEHFAKDGNELVIFRPKLPPRQGANNVAGSNGQALHAGQNGKSGGKNVVVGGPKSPSGNVPTKSFYTPKTVEAFPPTKPQTVPTQPGSIKTAGPKQPINPKHQASTDKNHNPSEAGVPTVIKPGPGSIRNDLVGGSKTPTPPVTSVPSGDNTVRPNSPPVKQQPSSIFLNGKNAGSGSSDPVPPNSLVLSGPKSTPAQQNSGNVPATKNPGYYQPRTVGASGSTLPNMNLANQQKAKEFQNTYGNYLNSRNQNSGGNSSQPNAAQNTVSQPNTVYQPVKPSSPSSGFSKPASLAEAAPTQPRWTMPSRPSGNDGGVQRPSGAQSSSTYQPFSQPASPRVITPQAPRAEVQQPARWQDFTRPSAPASASKPQWTMPAQSSSRPSSAPRESASPRSYSAPAVRSAPAESRSAPSVRSSSSGGSSSGSSRSSSSGNSSGNSSRSSSSSSFSKKH